VPTLQEQGVAGYDLSEWTGLIAPAKTPPAIIRELNTLFATAARHPDVAKKLQSEGNIIVSSSPDQFRQRIAMETERWHKVISAAGIKVEP
jgi:tripartite-type tricarboxylate transporter receptor subunit TctC